MPNGRPPDVKAMVLTDAKRILEDSGWSIAAVQVTRPPRGTSGEGGVFRVVRQRTKGKGQVALTLIKVP
ncbi:MAG: hypothetical protein GX349_08060 [Firmicutes bacterium]|nr:hypothetical protein [Bacillota bacterium]